MRHQSCRFDREWLVSELGFSSESENSIDAVNDRDYVLEFLACAALVQVHSGSSKSNGRGVHYMVKSRVWVC